MNNFKELFPKDLYHSYVVEGEPNTTSFGLCEFLKDKEGNNIEILCQVYDSFSISDSELIKEWHKERSITDSKRVCIIGAKFINHDAERTLLKIIEEPAVKTHFFLVVPNVSVLLDTIRSRTHTIKTNNNNNALSKINAEDFLKDSLKNRLDIIAEMIKDSKDDENSGNLRYGAIKLINEIEKLYYERFKKDRNNKEIQFVLNELQKNRDYLSTPGASVKMILEHIALVI